METQTKEASQEQAALDRYGHLLPETQQHVGEHLDAQIFGAQQALNPVGV